ncbi:MAG: transporter [Hydrocarboniphaga sp.]|nr:transporter [Hydrocarboniphaga sp.]
MYDWGNSAFATTVVAGLFPIFFEQYWANNLDSGTRTFWLGVASSASSLAVVVLAPLLGSVADRGGLKKRFLAVFTALGVLSTAAFYWVGQGQWMIATLLFTLGSIGFQAGTSFYDSLIVNVARDHEMDRVSSLGYGLGYLGGGGLFALNVLMVLRPQWFGLADAAAATKLSFMLVAIWWAVFAIPLFRAVPEARLGHNGMLDDLRSGFAQLAGTIHELSKLKPVWMFLFAYWLYIDGVDTIVRMAVDYGLTLGFPSSSLIAALLMVQFIGFPAAIGFGFIAGKIGTRRALYIALSVYIGVTAYAYLLQTVAQFYIMAAAIGLVQGGVQALSRSYYARLIPADKSGEFFGFYNMLGKFAAVLGPIAVGVTKLLTGDARLAILILVLFFIVGMLLLSRVPDPARSLP